MYPKRSNAVALVSVAALLCTLLTATHSHARPSLDDQRSWFLDAEQALSAGQLQRFDRLSKKLANYPLLPYLEAAELERRLGSAGAAEVKRFLEARAGTPVADGLRRKWLDHLAKRKRWQSYLAFYTPQASITRQCHMLQARMASGDSRQVWDQVRTIWLHGESRPKACDPVFDAWETAGQRTPELTWERIELAMDKGQWRLARYLGRKLAPQERIWVERWIRVHHKPSRVLDLKTFSASHPYRETILAYGARRQAKFDGLKGMSTWLAIRDLYPFLSDTRYSTHRRIALALEREPDPQAYAFILDLRPRADDERLFTARKRAALLRHDWPQLLSDLQLGPKGADDKERWEYWKARALQATGQDQAADKLYRQLAAHRSYYGFLAADRIGADYALSHADTQVSKQAMRDIRYLPGVLRALELRALERDIQARREWYAVTRELDREHLKAAALIAEQADWRDQAIFTLARTDFWDDLKLRFPLAFKKLVENQAQTHQLDTAWVFAVIRQESAFMRDARSHAGALGLMQLMPGTARHVAKDYLKQRPPKRSALLQADTNIELGSAYLRQLLDQLDGSPVLATAAYNAGPHRVDNWLPSQELDADIWVDLVPFNETRRYLRRVLYYMVIYEKRLGREPTRLSDRMTRIAAAAKPGNGA